MLAKITDTNPVGHLGFDITLKHLSIALDNFSFVSVIVPKYQFSPPALSLLLVSGSRSWSFPCHFQEGNYIIQGEISTKELYVDLSFKLLFNNIQCSWMQMRLDMTNLDDATKWSNYFSGYKRLMPALKSWGISEENIKHG